MSDKVNPVPPLLGTPNTAGEPVTPGDQAVAIARDVPDFIEKASSLDPELAKKWTGIALINSKTVWGTALALIVTFLVKKYSLGWDPDMVNLICGWFIFGVVTGLRMISEHPVTGFFKSATPAEAAQTAATK